MDDGNAAGSIAQRRKERKVKMHEKAGRIDILGVELEWLLKLEATGDKYCMLAARVPAGVGVPPHRHPDQESFFVLEGQAEFALDVNGELVWNRAGAGELVNIPPEALHGFRNAGSSDVRLLITGTEGLGRFFAEAGRELAEGESPQAQPTMETVQRVLAIAEKYGQQFMAPA